MFWVLKKKLIETVLLITTTDDLLSNRKNNLQMHNLSVGLNLDKTAPWETSHQEPHAMQSLHILIIEL